MESGFITDYLLPLSLFIIMMGMGMSLILADFKRILIEPKAVILGLLGQVLVLPMLGFLVAISLAKSPEVAVGILLISACPGGTSSNLITHLAQGDTALSITLTAFSSLITVFTIPVVVSVSMGYFLSSAQQIDLPVLKTIVTLSAITLLPVFIGMMIRKFAADFAIRQETKVNVFSGLFLALMVVLLIADQFAAVKAGIINTGLATVTLNVVSMVLGYLTAKIFSLNKKQSTSITIEIGVQNGTLAILVATTLLHSPALAIPAAIYSLSMFLTSFFTILLARKKTSAAKVIEQVS